MSDKRTAFITGFPGFLATYLVDRLDRTDDYNALTLLVEPKMVDRATDRLTLLGLQTTTEVVVGDITEPGLGIDAIDADEVWHLAAIYNLSVPESLAETVNIEGTKNVVDACIKGGIERLNYMSTCYVSGKRRGLIFEDELEDGKGFHNHYESTKFAAEKVVRSHMSELPTTILRPAIVVGNARTGQTDKYDGPYYILNAIADLPNIPLPGLGESTASANMIPVDFAVDAMVAIGTSAETIGQVHQIADPEPMTPGEIFELMKACLGKPKSAGRIPNTLLEIATHSKFVSKKTGIPAEVFAYFQYPAQFDTTNSTEFLANAGIYCPHLSSYMQTLVDYLTTHASPGLSDRSELV